MLYEVITQAQIEFPASERYKIAENLCVEFFTSLTDKPDTVGIIIRNKHTGSLFIYILKTVVCSSISYNFV